MNTYALAKTVQARVVAKGDRTHNTEYSGTSIDSGLYNAPTHNLYLHLYMQENSVMQWERHVDVVHGLKYGHAYCKAPPLLK